MNDQPIIPPLNLSPNLFDHKGVVFGKMQNPLSVVPCTFPQTTPCDTQVANKSCGALNFKETPPSMLLDEPTILNQERIGQCSEACKCGI